MKKIAVFASGGGSNFQAIIDAVTAGTIKGKLEWLFSNVEDAGCVDRAKKHHIPFTVVSHQGLSADEFNDHIMAKLEEHQPDVICLAGYLRMVGSRIVEKYRHRMINVHPALLPSFGGKGMYGHRVHEAVVASGVKLSGCTVHFVDEIYDHGPIILQKTVPVGDSDSPDDVAARVLEQEHQAYAEAVALFCADRLRVEGRKVIVK